MNKLDKTLETLKETKKGHKWGDQMHKEAIEYLESLKPVLPKYVADWLDGKLKALMLSEFVMLWEEGEAEIPYEVQEWFDDKDIVIVLANITQFGYTVEE